MDTILVVNAGSSSVKFQVFAVEGAGGLQRQIKGQMDGIGSRPRLRASGPNGDPLADRAYPVEAVADVPAAMSIAGAWLRELNVNPIAVGHRVVHGGPDHARPVLIDHAVVSRLERYVSLAPLHQPYNLAPIRTLLGHSPSLPQVACFDTAFHRDHDAVADHYAIPYQLHAEGVRRYGFHGLSYEYIAKRLPRVAPEIASGRVIVAHLGSGASMCAIKGGKSVESTMGFTALDGLAMGTHLYFTGDKPLLFNLKDDPGEFSNLAGNPQHAGVQRELHGVLTSLLDPDTVTERAFAEQARVLQAMVQRLKPQEFHDVIVGRLGTAQAHVLTARYYRAGKKV